MWVPGRRARGVLSRGGKGKVPGLRTIRAAARRTRRRGISPRRVRAIPPQSLTTVVSERVTVPGVASPDRRSSRRSIPRVAEWRAGSPIGATMPLRVRASGSKPANRRGDVNISGAAGWYRRQKKCRRSRARIAARAKNLPVGGTRISLHWRRADARGTSGLRVRRAVLSRSRRSLGEDRPRASRRTSAPLVWFRASDRSRGRDGFFPGSPTQGLAGGGDVQADARDVGVP